MKELFITYLATFLGIACALWFMPFTGTLLVNAKWLTPDVYNASWITQLAFCLPFGILILFGIVMPIFRYLILRHKATKRQKLSFTGSTTFSFVTSVLSIPFLNMKNGQWYHNDLLCGPYNNWAAGSILAFIGLAAFILIAAFPTYSKPSYTITE